MSLITEINWNKLDAFSGDYDFLSNFYPAVVEYHGFMYPTSEHAFAAQKAREPNAKALIAASDSPGLAKVRGRRCTIRPDWEEIKDQVMLEAVRDKFTRHRHLGAALLLTGVAELIEWNCWHDKYWGMVVVGTDPKTYKEITEGKNMLGKILMKVRTEIREKSVASN